MKDVEEQTECPAHRLSGPGPDLPSSTNRRDRLGGRRLAKSLGQLADLGFWVAARRTTVIKDTITTVPAVQGWCGGPART